MILLIEQEMKVQNQLDSIKEELFHQDKFNLLLNQFYQENYQDMPFLKVQKQSPNTLNHDCVQLFRLIIRLNSFQVIIIKFKILKEYIDKPPNQIKQFGQMISLKKQTQQILVSIINILDCNQFKKSTNIKNQRMIYYFEDSNQNNSKKGNLNIIQEKIQKISNSMMTNLKQEQMTNKLLKQQIEVLKESIKIKRYQQNVKVKIDQKKQQIKQQKRTEFNLNSYSVQAKKCQNPISKKSILLAKGYPTVPKKSTNLPLRFRI